MQHLLHLFFTQKLTITYHRLSMSGQLIVNTDAIRQNILNIKSKIRDALFCAVVKANCYGFGFKLCSYIDDLVDMWAVATVDEAKTLANLTDKDILILSPPDYDEIKHLDLPQIIYAVDSVDTIKQMSSAERGFSVHVVVNTGMNRYGADFKSYKQIFKAVSKCNNIKIKGVFSHFYKNSAEVMKLQYDRFEKFAMLAKKQNPSAICHISNSKGICYPMDMVRVGIDMYLSGDTFRLLGFIKEVRTINNSDAVSYNANFVASKRTKIAIVSLGYADGIMRKLSGFSVLVNDTFCPIVGDICMDCFMIDVSKVKRVKRGDKVVIIGKDYKESISVCQLAHKCDTISYEMLSRLGDRIERIYLNHAGYNRKV